MRRSRKQVRLLYHIAVTILQMLGCNVARLMIMHDRIGEALTEVMAFNSRFVD